MKEFLKSMPKLNHDAKIGFVLNDFTNLKDDELSLLNNVKYNKYNSKLSPIIHL